MHRIRTTEAAAHLGQPVQLQGWLHQLRALGTVNCLVLRDGWGLCQAVVDDPAALSLLRTVQAESIIELHGRVAAEPQAPGGVELHDTRVTVLAPVEDAPPLAVNTPELRATLDTIIEQAVVSWRHPSRRAVLRLAAALVAGFRAALDARGFTEIHTPKISDMATEGGADAFPVDYFGQPACLAPSPQLYKQLAVGMLERVYEVGPAFRAAPHATSRHLAEFVSLDAELGFIEDHTTLMALLTDVVAAMLAEARHRCAPELALLDMTLPAMSATIPTLSFADAQDVILDRYGLDCRGQADLTPEHERMLGHWAADAHHADFLFVTGYPMATCAFYTHPHSTAPGRANAFTLLCRGLAVATGGQRLHRYGDYLAALRAREMAPEPLAEYLTAFRYGMPPHGGFAIGLERVLMQLLRLPNIRLATLFPRDLMRLAP